MIGAVRRADDGVALLMAIIFVAVVGTIAGSVVSLASTNLRATGVYASESGLSTTADGAVQLAANTVRRTAWSLLPLSGAPTLCSAPCCPRQVAGTKR